MSSPTAVFFDPIARDADLHRLAIRGGEAPRPPAEVWDELHDRVQTALRVLDDEVGREVAGVCVLAGRTAGRAFHLFSYRTFSVPGSLNDSVVVGMTFTPAASNAAVVIQADVSGEQLGDAIFSLPPATVRAERGELQRAAEELAQRLRQTHHRIVQALADDSRRIE